MRTLGRLLGFLAPEWSRVALASVLGVATIASNMGLLALAAYVVAAAALKPALAALALPIYLVRLCSVCRGGARYAERLTAHDVTFRVLARLRPWFYSRLEPLTPAWLRRQRSGDLLSRLVADIDDLENVYLRGLAPLVVAVLVVGLTAALFAAFSPLLALTAVAFLVAGGAGAPLLIAALARGWGRRDLEVRAALQAEIVDGVQGLQDLLACGAEGRHHQRIVALGDQLEGVQRWLALLEGLRRGLHDLVTHGALWAILALAIPLVSRGTIPGVYLALLALAILSSFEAVGPLARGVSFLGRSLAAGERLWEVVDAPAPVSDPPRPLPPPEDWTLEFDRVRFAYGDDKAVLDGVSFRLRAGTHVAVVGPSGAGKSTLVDLAVRFYDPTGGAVLLGGQTLSGYAQEDLRQGMAVAMQETHIFNDTVRANLLLARPEATDAEVMTALDQAQLGAVVRALPQGLETRVGEQGAALSGGERQRLSLARVLLRDAPLLVLDEPTANLDAVTERRLLETVRAHRRERTTLLITHRLVAMEEMDEILVLEGGRIVERGTHAQLLGVGGLYRQMLEVQNGMLEESAHG